MKLRLVIAGALALLGGAIAGAAPHAAARTAADDIKYTVGFVCENSQAPHADDDMFTDGAVVFVSGVPEKPQGGLTTRLANLHAPDSVQIDLAPDGQSAWFQTTCRGRATYPQSADDCARTKAKGCDPYATAYHASGHIVHDGAWKLDVLVLTATDSNAMMRSRADAPLSPKYTMPTSIETHGDAALGAAIADWFAAGDLSKSAAAASGPVLAGGSAPEEVGMDAAARKLVASWTGLHMALVSVDASVTGERGVARGKIRFEVPRRGVVQLTFVAIAVRDGDTWRWRLIDFVT
jgi:hypothetical protein